MKVRSTIGRNFLLAITIQSAIFQFGHAGSDEMERFPPFRLTNWDGREISLETLRGNRSIVVFTFAYCVINCPMVTQYLKDLDTEMGQPKDLRLVHISVNPADDTPEEILRHFAKFGIDPVKDPRWLFLNGPADRLEMTLAENGIEVRKRQLPTGELIEHPIRVVVLDRDGGVVDRFSTYFWEKERMTNALQ